MHDAKATGGASTSDSSLGRRSWATAIGRLLRRVGICLISVVAVFWPVAYYHSSIDFDSALFTTEWLKIVFSSVILFAIVEVLLERNRALSRHSAFGNLLSTEVIAPLRDAIALTSTTRTTITSGGAFEGAAFSRLNGICERVSAAVNYLPIIAGDAALAASAHRLVTAFQGYEWSVALREFRETTEWRAANVAEFERFASHLSSFHNLASAALRV